ncbi:MAG TPA: HAMP domain-containing sensor histidine kinase, partial [Holophagaceae bacterium]|nr:HAMP domain-containing sensor histidine kinase [Holophagaceae bacterium]
LASALSNALSGPLLLLDAVGGITHPAGRMWGATLLNGLEVLSRLLLLAGLASWPPERPGGLAAAQRSLGGLLVSACLLFGVLTLVPDLLEVFVHPTSPYGPVNLTFLLDLLAVLACLSALLAAGLDLPEEAAQALGTLPLALCLYLAVLAVQSLLVVSTGQFRWDGPTAWPLLVATGGLLQAALAPVPERRPARAAVSDWLRPAILALPVTLALAWASWLALARPGSVTSLARAVGITIAALLLLRLFLAQRELQSFNHRLEREVTERTRALEESVSAVLKTQRLNMVATLGAGLAHDFRNLLTVILGSSELLMLKREAGQAIEPADLEAIRGAAQRGRQLAQQLMSLGRQSDLAQPVDFDLSAQVKAFLPLLERMLPASVKLLAEVEAPLAVRADPRQVEQVLVNLVANARDALPRGGRIRIRTSRIDTEAGPWARLQVEDDGSGMEPGVLERIFEPFFTTKAPGQGTGLGLASVKGIVETWGGRLRATSAPGEGSTFTVDLRLGGA